MDVNAYDLSAGYPRMVGILGSHNQNIHPEIQSLQLIIKTM